MLKIKDKNGKTVMVLKDDANEPVLIESQIEIDKEEDKAKLNKEEAEEEE